MICYLNGEFVSQVQASIGISDLALLRGYGLFDFFVFEEGEPRFLEDYLDRFTRSAKAMRLELPVGRQELAQQIRLLIEKNDRPAGGIRLLLTGGYADDSYTPQKPNLLILQYPFPQPPARHMELGARAMTYQYQREMPEVKTINYLRGIWLLPELRENEADYVLYHDGEYLRESDRSNVFLVTQEGELVTPATKILAGITRMKMLELAPKLGMKTTVREVRVEELVAAKEVFITSSIKGAMPVIAIDGRPVGDGTPGAVCGRLQKAFQALISA